MFAFFRNRRKELDASNQIGKRLRSQVYAAMQENAGSASDRLQGPFATGYVYMFIRMSYLEFGIDGETATDRRLKHILEGIIPGRLHDIFQRQLAAVELAKKLGKEEVTKSFESGLQCGASDATHTEPRTGEGPRNLYKHLLGRPVEFYPMQGL